MSTDGLALNCVPEGDRAISCASHDLSSLSRPSDGADLLLSNQGSVEFRQLFPAGLVEVEDVDFSVVEAAAEEIVAVGFEVQASDGAALVVAQGDQQLGFFSLDWEGGT